MADVSQVVNDWFTANPNASTSDVAKAVQTNGGMTPELASALASHYGTDTNAVTSAYNQLTAPTGSASTPQNNVQAQSISPLGGNAVNDQGQTGGSLSVGATGNFQSGQNAIDVLKPFSSSLAPATANDSSQAFNQTYNALQYGNTQIKPIDVVDQESGSTSQRLGLVDSKGNTLPPDNIVDMGNGIYDIQIGSAGGTIHTYVKQDPTTGNIQPIQDYQQQVSYTGGQHGGFVNSLASAASSIPFLNVAASIVAPEALPYIQGLNAVNAANKGNISGAVLSALGASNALPSDLLPIDKSTLKDVTNVASGVNAVVNKNPLGLASAVMNATDTKLPSDVGAGVKLASAYISMQKGDMAGMMNSMMSFAKSQDPNVSKSAQKVVDAVQSGADPKVALDQFTKDVGIPSDVASVMASLSPDALAKAGYGTNVATLASADPNFTPVSSPLSGDTKKATDTTDTSGTDTTDTTAKDTGGFTGGNIGYYQQQLDNLTNSGIPEDLAKSLAKSLTNDAISKNQSGDTFWIDPVTGQLHISFSVNGQNTNTGEGGEKTDITPVGGTSTETSGSVSPLTGGSATGVANVKVDIDPNTGNKTEITTDPTTGLTKTTVTDTNGKVISDTSSPLNTTDLGSVNVVGKKISDGTDTNDLGSINIIGKKIDDGGGSTDTSSTSVDKKVVDKTCGAGYHWDEASQSCVKDTVTHNCGAGYHWDEASQSCVKDTDTSTVTLPSVTTKTASDSPLTSASAVGDKALPMVATMLAGAPVYNEKHQLAQLHQLYDSLDPHLASVLQQAGIIPPEPPRETKKSEEPSQSDIEKILAEAKSNEPDTAQPFLFAEGGSTFSDLVKNTEYKNIAPVAPTMLSAAPVVQQESRLSPLHHLKQGIRKDAQATSLLAHGGVPHKYKEAAPKGHNPEFITGLTGYYADGKGTGQSDDIPAMLHEGDHVADADVVAALGDGSSKAGAQVLDNLRKSIPYAKGGEAKSEPVPAKIADGEYVFPAAFVTALGGGDNKLGAKLLDTMREELRKHKRSAPDNKIPPKAFSPLKYIEMGLKGKKT